MIRGAAKAGFDPGTDVIIGETAVIGRNVRPYPGVMLGPNDSPWLETAT